MNFKKIIASVCAMVTVASMGISALAATNTYTNASDILAQLNSDKNGTAATAKKTESHRVQLNGSYLPVANSGETTITFKGKDSSSKGIELLNADGDSKLTTGKIGGGYGDANITIQINNDTKTHSITVERLDSQDAQNGEMTTTVTAEAGSFTCGYVYIPGNARIYFDPGLTIVDPTANPPATAEVKSDNYLYYYTADGNVETTADDLAAGTAMARYTEVTVNTNGNSLNGLRVLLDGGKSDNYEYTGTITEGTVVFGVITSANETMTSENLYDATGSSKWTVQTKDSDGKYTVKLN